MSNDPASNWYAPPTAASVAAGTAQAVSPEGVQYAGFGVRAGARIIDLVVAGIVGAAGGAIATPLAMLLVEATSAERAVEVTQTLNRITAPSFILGTLASIAYHALSEGLGGASVGKLAVGLRVRKADLSPCTIGPAIGRTFAYYLDSFFFGLVGYGSMSKSPRQQRYGDKWAGTVVVRNASLPPDSAAGSVGLGIALGLIASVVLAMTGTLSKVLF